MVYILQLMILMIFIDYFLKYKFASTYWSFKEGRIHEDWLPY